MHVGGGVIPGTDYLLNHCLTKKGTKCAEMEVQNIATAQFMLNFHVRKSRASTDFDWCDVKMSNRKFCKLQLITCSKFVKTGPWSLYVVSAVSSCIYLCLVISNETQI